MENPGTTAIASVLLAPVLSPAYIRIYNKLIYHWVCPEFVIVCSTQSTVSLRYDGWRHINASDQSSAKRTRLSQRSRVVRYLLVTGVSCTCSTRGSVETHSISTYRSIIRVASYFEYIIDNILLS